jgi:cold-inducible RNA-binding protein
LRIYIGNFGFETSEQELREAFEGHGQVQEVSMIQDRETGRPKGFAFVEMPTGAEAEAAIGALNGKEFGGRPVTVNEARPRQERSGGGYGGGGGGGFGGGRGGNRGSRRQPENHGLATDSAIGLLRLFVRSDKNALSGFQLSHCCWLPSRLLLAPEELLVVCVHWPPRARPGLDHAFNFPVHWPLGASFYARLR